MRILPLALVAGFTCTLALGVGSAHAAPPATAAKPAAAKSAVKYDEAKLTALEAKLTKNPKDAKLKSEVAEANFQVGYATMMNPELPPRMKYGAALKKYRRALALNPKHAEALKNKDMIEGIYKQMGRPVPQ